MNDKKDSETQENQPSNNEGSKEVPLSSSGSEEIPIATPKNHNSHSELETRPNSPSLFDSIISQIHVWKIRWKTRERGEKAKWTDKAVAWFTLGILLAAVIQGVIFGLQWHEMVTAGQQAERAIKETNRLAKATEDSNRPWLGLAGPIVLGETEVKNRYSASYLVKNFGKTPAFKAMAQLWFVSGDAKEWDETARIACELNMPFTKGTIPVAPNLKQGPPMGKALFPDQGLGDSIPWEIPEGKQWMAFVGCVTYKDALENYHWTRFCMESPNWNYTGKPFILGPKTPLHLCNVYNDTDDKKPEEKQQTHP
jgi:hypothetical protein